MPSCPECPEIFSPSTSTDVALGRPARCGQTVGLAVDVYRMDVESFERWWRSCRRTDLEWLVDAVAAATDTTDAEVERLRAGRELARVVARTHRRRDACEAKHRLRVVAIEACASTGLRAADPAGATLLARAAGDAAFALVAAPGSACCETMIRPFASAAVPHVA